MNDQLRAFGFGAHTYLRRPLASSTVAFVYFERECFGFYSLAVTDKKASERPDDERYPTL